jgi:hypothetical protein
VVGKVRSHPSSDIERGRSAGWQCALSALSVHGFAELEVVVERARKEPAWRAGGRDLALEEVVGHVEATRPRCRNAG